MAENQTSELVKSISYLLASVGAVNWGLVGLLDFNLVSALLGEGSLITQIVYIVVGLSGISSLFHVIKKYV
ncbi:membrane protein [Candidatus Phycorickettsia trachydisci]|uniref:Membrane protein n=1 Tax=Candidatus Phycorickettsia trachydisci TaxID=2115978 RepID=A0A2P1P8D4_9RICK|nr:DUF378 domain-containing protein [Candidatus Phycorickettsia trachydisci]AVP87529.1 membrane protein [Candidatus Phycorickettsia trachydisci]